MDATRHVEREEEEKSTSEVFHNAASGQRTHYNDVAEVRDDQSVLTIFNGPPELTCNLGGLDIHVGQ